MKKIISTALILAICLAFIPTDVNAAQYDFSAYPDMGVSVYETESKDTVISNNGDKEYYPGSIIKILTVLTALEHLEKDNVVTVSEEALDLAKPNSSLADLESGEQLSVEELIYGALLPSGNDAAIVLAVAAGRAILNNTAASASDANSAFVEAMNRKAAYLNMTNSRFANSDGYDDPNNISTPNDLVKLASAALENELIKQVVGTKTYSLTTNITSHTWKSTNIFYYDTFDPEMFTDSDISGVNPYYDDRVYGMKSGYTDLGLRCFMFAAKDNEKSYIGVVLKVPVENKLEIWARTYDIINFGFDNYKIVAITNDENILQKVPWRNPSFLIPFSMKLNMKYETFACVEKEIDEDDIYFNIVPCEGVSEVDEKGRLTLLKDVNIGDTVAYAQFYIGDKFIKSVELIASTGYSPGGIADIFLYVVFIGVIIGIAVSLRHVEKKRKRKVEH